MFCNLSLPTIHWFFLVIVDANMLPQLDQTLSLGNLGLERTQWQKVAEEVFQ